MAKSKDFGLYKKHLSVLTKQQQNALKQGYLSRDQTIDSNPLRSLQDEEDLVLSEKKNATGAVRKSSQQQQSHSNSAIFRKSKKALNGTAGARQQMMSEREGTGKQQRIQEYSSLADMKANIHQGEPEDDQSDQSFQIFLRDDASEGALKQGLPSQGLLLQKDPRAVSKWQGQVVDKLIS